LYETCCQRPDLLAPAIARLHGGHARTLHEDFCGSAALSRAWCMGGSDRTALGTDKDAEAVGTARARCDRAGLDGQVMVVQSDVLNASLQPASADVVFVGNFSVGELHSRADLLRYLLSARVRLRTGGMLMLDVFGTPPAPGKASRTRTFPREDGVTISSTWEQREYDPWTGLIRCMLHFRAAQGGEVLIDLPDAFAYHWRVWGVPELRDALRESGFGDVCVVDPLAPDVQPGHESAAVCMVCRA
jgi:SAM-dependent methyltransferase